MKDRYLIEQSKKGNVRAFAKIYDKYVEKIYRFIFLKTSQKEEAEDLTSQVFLHLLDKIKDIKDKESEIRNLQAFLYQIAKNLVIDFYRVRGVREVSLEKEIKDNLTDPKDLGRNIIVNSDVEMIRDALNKIREEYQEAVIFYYLEEMSVKEIAKMMDRSEGAVRQLISRGIKSLRKELNNK